MRRFAIIVALLCLAADDATPFERGLAHFKAGEHAASIPPLEEAHAAEPDDADIALLLGIAYYRTHQKDRARPLLEQAAAHGDADARASAQMFLGLIADDRGESERAHGYYEQVARTSPALATSARMLIDQAGPARWSVVGVMRPGFDSNVELLPMTTGFGKKSSADAEATMIAAVSARPFASAPFVVDETVSYEKHAQYADYDMLADRIGGAYTFVGKGKRATLAYHFEASRLGGESYARVHFVDVAARRRLADAYAIAARYTLAVQGFGASYADYSGLMHTGHAEVVYGSRTRFELAGGYQVERQSTESDRLTYFGHGPRGSLVAHPWDGGDLRISLLVIDRIYGQGHVLHGEFESALFVDLSNALSLVFGATSMGDVSGKKNDRYLKWTVFAGLVFELSS